MSTGELLFADRSNWGKSSVTGEQRAWFLHQITTRSFEDIAPKEARAAAMLTAKGRMAGYFEAVETGEELLLHYEPSLHPQLPDALRRYLFATRAEVLEADDWGLVLAVGGDWQEALRRAAPESVIHATSDLGAPAGYAWTPLSRVEDVLEAMRGQGAKEASEDDLEAVRVSAGAPRWGFEMNESTLPLDVGLDGIALDLDKGCYVGQEVVAKIHFRGRVTRALRRLDAEGPLVRGASVRAGEAAVGTVTSAAGTAGLAVLKADIASGSVVQAGDIQAKVWEAGKP